MKALVLQLDRHRQHASQQDSGKGCDRHDDLADGLQPGAAVDERGLLEVDREERAQNRALGLADLRAEAALSVGQVRDRFPRVADADLVHLDRVAGPGELDEEGAEAAVEQDR